ncbi:hypothetical protein [Microbacterium sp. SLBN-111]|uniref:hypothetical protein n=1 Tax=Microbacterium sp. SLBN-111 TaxID=3377733 RepID=UPI003C775F20
MVGPISEVGAFQRRRVRLTGLAIAAMALVSLALVLWSAAMVGISTIFGAATPVRLPIVAFIAAIVLSPVLWSAIFRSHRYGLTITEDELVIESWWRRRTFRRAELSAAEPLPAVMRMRDGYFSARGSNSALFAVWLWPGSPEQDEIQLGVTTGTWEATSIAAKRINAWLGAEVEFDEERAYRLLDED